VLKRGKSDVYRLRMSSGSTLIAKRSAIETSRIERTVYREVLARLPLAHLACLGFVEDGDRAWLFLEDAGDVRLTASRLDREKAGRWLARLHVEARAVRSDVELPLRDAAHQFDMVGRARQTLDRGRANPALPPAGRRSVESLLRACDRVEANLGQVEVLASSFDATLVHGGLAGKNVRSRGDDVLAFDWEAAGWGFPVMDLALADPESYRVEAARIGSPVEPSWLEAAVPLGRVLWCLAAIPGEQDHLVAPWAGRVAGKLEFYARESEAALQDGGW
jgi:Phosphotransferase enzyme family